MLAEAKRKKWTSEEAARLIELFPDQRYELIEGELFDKMGQKPPHASIVSAIASLLNAAFPNRVRSQTSIRLPGRDGLSSEPEPDVVVLNRTNLEFFAHHPGPESIHLLIEVADTSFATGRTVKYRLYARAGIVEYWIVDLANQRAIVCREPLGDEYRSVTIHDADEELSPRFAPDFHLRLQTLFPPGLRD